MPELSVSVDHKNDQYLVNFDVLLIYLVEVVRVHEQSLIVMSCNKRGNFLYSVQGGANPNCGKS